MALKQKTYDPDYGEASPSIVLNIQQLTAKLPTGPHSPSGFADYFGDLASLVK